MVLKARDEFLIVAKFMNPAQSDPRGQPIELGSIIADQQIDDGIARLAVVESDGQRIQDVLAHLWSHGWQACRKPRSDLLPGQVSLGCKHRGELINPLGTHPQLPQALHSRFPVSETQISSP